MRRATALAALGALTFVALHVLLMATWQTWFHGGDTLPPWFMNSARGLAVGAVVFAAVGLCVSARDRNPAVDTRFVSAAWLALGALVPMAAVLFTMRGGPGTLFPIAIAIGSGIVFVSAAAGGCLGWAFGRLLRRDS
ncbi:MAG TPA: hypothetical protein VFB07_05460 [Vicinamibacterales bacterium]|nr:hypothetical protein [Vicinamibacterales bacterium]